MEITTADRNQRVIAVAPMIIAAALGLPSRFPAVGRAGVGRGVAARYQPGRVDNAGLAQQWRQIGQPVGDQVTLPSRCTRPAIDRMAEDIRAILDRSYAHHLKDWLDPT